MSREFLTSPLGSLEIPGVPYSLRVLEEGFCIPQPQGTFRAQGSITLIRGGPVTALVDTGGPWGAPRLLQLLAAQGLSPRDVTHVVCTHGHSDHAGNLNLFPEATMVVGLDLSRGDGLYYPHAMARGAPYPLHPGYLEVVATPGHTLDHVSLVARGTSLGTVVVAGDLFEKEGDEGEWREWSQDPQKQEESRRKVAAMADVVVPGHGAPFRVCRAGDEDTGQGTPGEDPKEEEEEEERTGGGSRS